MDGRQRKHLCFGQPYRRQHHHCYAVNDVTVTATDHTHKYEGDWQHGDTDY